jgi:hypothetical protein
MNSCTQISPWACGDPPFSLDINDPSIFDNDGTYNTSFPEPPQFDRRAEKEMLGDLGIADQEVKLRSDLLPCSSSVFFFSGCVQTIKCHSSG